jgi:hypothetical protein
VSEWLNPEFALGISEIIGGRVKRVKKVKCYNVDSGEGYQGKCPQKRCLHEFNSASDFRPL